MSCSFYYNCLVLGGADKAAAKKNEDSAVTEEKISVANHRIEDLERAQIRT